jgi:hypothetical protein
MVYVLSQEGQPLMSTERHGKVRHMLKDGRAAVVTAKPFTIQLTYETTTYTQEATLGDDSGYLNDGFSVITEKAELIAGTLRMLKDMKDRLAARAKARGQRRSRLRYRRNKGLDNHKEKGWLAPSIQHKLDTQLKLVNWLSKILPITKVIVEVANFDIQKIKKPGISGKEYQEGEQSNFWNLREYVLHRDNHQCQNPECTSKSKKLHVHHIGYWKNDKTDRPGNVITLCEECNHPRNHKKGKFLWGWEPEVKSFKPATFMTTVRWKIVNALGCEHTYGYTTKTNRIDLKLPKTHYNDAFVIAGGTTQKRCNPIEVIQVRRHNRCLRKFYDAKYIDSRTGETVSGQDLSNGRHTRNRELNEENLHIYRKQKVSKGRVQKRTRRYPFQPGDTVLYEGKKYTAKGTQNHGDYVKLAELPKPVRADKLKHLYYGKGFRIA